MSSQLFERKITNLGAGARMKMQHQEDPREVILGQLGEIPPEFVGWNKVMVALYIRPEKTLGGLILPDKSKDEDVFQGKVGLIVAMGPQAFVDDDNTKFHGVKYSVGDWVWFRASEGWAFQLHGVSCRLFHREGDIYGRLTHPDDVW
jgi:co-chaperonin GroES (HSP10)